MTTESHNEARSAGGAGVAGASLAQCPECLRYFANGQLVSLSRGQRVSASGLAYVACGWSDCGDVVRAFQAQESLRDEREQAAAKAQRVRVLMRIREGRRLRADRQGAGAKCRSGKHPTSNIQHPTSSGHRQLAGVRSPLPPEREEAWEKAEVRGQKEEVVEVGNIEQPVPLRQADTSMEALNQGAAMMAVFLKSFPVEWFAEPKPRRDLRSDWISNGEFRLLRCAGAPHGIARPNSRASALNVGQTVEGVLVHQPHELIARYDLWIDSRGGGENCVRCLCFREHSLRLKAREVRAAHNEDKQRALGIGETESKVRFFK